MSNILLTGRPGIGKTTAIKRILNELPEGTACGFLSQEIRESNRRVGFEIVTMEGERGILAHIHISGPKRLGKYGVDIEAIESIAIASLRNAREQDCLIIIDEIAKMELYAPGFAPEVRRCLETGRVLGTIQARRTLFLDEVRNRDDVLLLTLTEDNRDEVPERVLTMLRI